MRLFAIAALMTWGLVGNAKTFQNSYIAFEVPDDWTCAQEGVAWTCTPRNNPEAKEAVIVLAAKVAGPEDNIPTFTSFLKQPKKIVTKVGTPMPSQVMYAQLRALGGQNWVQSQHLGSEIQDYYTLYLATVKDRLAILISFSADKAHYAKYNPIFDKAIRTFKIVANQQLLFPKIPAPGAPDGFAIQGPSLKSEDLRPPPEQRSRSRTGVMIVLGFVLALIAGGLYIYQSKRKKISHSKSSRPRSK